MSLDLAVRAGRIKPSVTLDLVAKVKAMISKGEPVLRFDAGEPDFPTPGRIVQAGVRAMEHGKTGYTAASGIPELKQAVCTMMRKDFGLDYEPGNILISCGAKHSIYNAVSVLFQEGDEVLLLAPYWVSYPPMVEFNGATAVPVPVTAGETLPDLAAIESKIGHKTKGMIVNNPSNPSGVLMPKNYLESLSELAIERDLWVISDEIYAKLVFEEGGFTSFASLGPGTKERTITINGVSKTYAMTGWRIGFAAGPRAVISAMSALQSQSTSNPCTISQWAALEAITGPQDDVDAMVREFRRRRDKMVAGLNDLPGVTCPVPGGAFYVLADFSSYLDSEERTTGMASDRDLADYLLEEYMVATVPGSAFGAAGRLRLSFACSMETIEQGLARIEEALEKLRGETLE